MQYNINLDEETNTKLTEMVKACKLTRAEITRRALKLYYMVQFAPAESNQGVSNEDKR